jgi:hypothetical protein
MNTARGEGGGAGTQTAALAFTGSPDGGTNTTESWTGSSWTTVNSVNTARRGLGGVGLQTAALAFGGCWACNRRLQVYRIL